MKKILPITSTLSPFFVIITSLLFSLLSINTQANNELSALERNYHDKPLTIAINKLAYPYHFVDDKGEAKGLMVDLWKLWANKQNVEIKFIPLDWSDTLAQVAIGEVDIHASMTKTEKRLSTFDYTKTLVSFQSNLYLKRDLFNIGNIKDLAPYTIGTIKASSQKAFLEKHYPNLNLKTFDSLDDLYDAALNSQIIVFTGVENISRYYSHYDELNKLFPSQKRLSYRKEYLGGAVAKNNSALLAFINEGIDKLSSAERIEIHKKWFSVDDNKKSLTLTFSPDYPPFMALSPEGEPQGLLIDIWKLWSNHTNQEIDFIPENLSKGIELVNNKNADVQLALTKSFDSSKVKDLMVAHKIYVPKLQIYMSKKIANVTNLNKLSQKISIGIISGSPIKEQIIKQFPKLSIKYFNTYLGMLQAAELGEIDAITAATEHFNRLLLNSNLQSSFYIVDEPIFYVDLYSFVHSENTALLESIEDGFSQIPLSALVALEEKWLMFPEDGYFYKKTQEIKLTKKEKNWLTQHKTINVGMTRSLAPVEFINNSGEPDGVNHDIFNLVKQRTGINFNYTIFESWDELLTALLNKEIDILASATPTEKRKNQLFFSEPYWEMPWVVIHPRHTRENSDLESFYGKKLAIVKGYYFIAEIANRHPNISLVLVDTLEDGLIAVQQGLVDGFIETMAIASGLLNRENLVPLSMSVLESLNQDKSHFALRKDYPELLSIVNKGLQSISDNEKQAISEKWFQLHINTGLDRSVVMKVSAQIAAMIIFVLAIIIYWNRRLSLEIKNRIALENKMKHMATHDELTGLANRTLLKESLNSAISFHQRQSLKLAVIFIDLDGFKFINDTYGHDVGDELLVQVAARLLHCVRESDSVVRFGGDEFVLLLTGLHDGNEATYVAEKVLREINLPFKLSAVDAEIGCSMGIAIYPDDGVTESDLLKMADILMYKVKAKGKNNYILNHI